MTIHVRSQTAEGSLYCRDDGNCDYEALAFDSGSVHVKHYECTEADDLIMAVEDMLNDMHVALNTPDLRIGYDVSDIQPLMIVCGPGPTQEADVVKSAVAAGFNVLGYSTYDCILELLPSSPAVDALVVVLNAHKIEQDVGRYMNFRDVVRNYDPEISLFAYSDEYLIDKLPIAERKMFTRVCPSARGASESFDAVARLWINEAKWNRTQRTRHAQREFRKLVRREVSQVDHIDFGELAAEQTHTLSAVSMEQLNSFGYRLTSVVGIGDGASFEIPVWVRSGTDYVTAEVFKRPSFYAIGANDREAVGNLVRYVLADNEGMN